MEGSSGFRLGYRPALDGFRGLAISLVVLYNLGLGLEGGYIGVDLFFVLSGFLITSLLLEEVGKTGRVDFRAFYMRRALRLLPALVFLLVVFCGAATVLKGVEAAREEYLGSLAALFYVANWVLALGPFYELMGPLAHTWSLSVEEQFYLVWPPLMALFLSRGGTVRGVARLTGAGILTAAAWRTHLSLSGASSLRIYAGTDTRADALLVGCFLAALFVARQPGKPRGGVTGQGTDGGRTAGLVFSGSGLWWVPWGAFFGLLAGAALFPEGGTLMECLGFLLVALLAGLLLGGLVTRPEGRLGRLFSLRPLVALGRVSYGLYLWHVVIASFLIQERLPAPEWALVGLRLVATAAAVAFSWFVIEQPALKLKRRWSRSGTK